MPRRSRRILAASLPLLLASCQTEERVIHYKPFLTGIEGAKSGTPAVLGASDRAADPDATKDEKILVIDPDGTKHVVCHSVAHLMAHVKRCLAENDSATFTQQVLAEQTVRQFEVHGMPPERAFAMLKADEKDVLKLFARMPMAENSPSIVREPLGERTMRVRVTGLAANGLKWTGFEMVQDPGRLITDTGSDGKKSVRFERGNWRLLWFVP